MFSFNLYIGLQKKKKKKGIFVAKSELEGIFHIEFILLSSVTYSFPLIKQ